MSTFKFEWQKMIASENGPKSPTERHVLLTLSLFMDEDGGSCFPSNRTLASATGLHRKSISTHLDSAAKTGWIQITEKAGTGQGWKRHRYRARFPEKVGKEIHRVIDEGGERDSPPQRRRGESGSKGGERHSQTRGKRFPLSVSNSHIPVSNDARTFLLKDGSTYQIEDDFFQILKATYPNINLESEFKKLSAWCHANPSKRKTKSGAKRFVNTWISNAKPTKDNQPVKEFNFGRQFHEE